MDRQKFILLTDEVIAASGTAQVEFDSKDFAGDYLACIFRLQYAATDGTTTGCSLSIKNRMGTTNPGTFEVPSTSDTLAEITLTTVPTGAGATDVGDQFVLEIRKFSEIFVAEIVNLDPTNAVTVNWEGYC